MRTVIATLAVASLIGITSVVGARAAPTTENVRIEGSAETLFEGPVWTEGHDVQASSDKEERPCDGTNNGQHATPGPTPTAAAVDAMSIVGETFDGKWYGGYDDYFITRWGPDEQSAAQDAYWGLLVNNVFTNIGGCQYELGANNEVLWVYNAFQSRPFLALLAVDTGYTSGARPLTATAKLGQPFEVEVLDYSDQNEDTPPLAPERTGSSPYEGADVSPVLTSAKGFELVQTASPDTVLTAANGRASITFTEPGWHRIKATAVGGGGEEDAVRSNRLDVCVPPEGSEASAPPLEGAASCKQTPAADQVREAPRYAHEADQEEPGQTGAGNGAGDTTVGTAGGSTAPPARVQTPVFDGQGAGQGLVGVSWRILEAGVGLSSWTIAARTAGTGGIYATVATGTSATSALLKLPPGAAYELQITFTDVLGRSSTTHIGKVLVPYDDRWSGLRYRGRWRRVEQPGAWLGTVSRGAASARVSARLGAGRPVFVLRGGPAPAQVEVLCGTRRQVFAVARGSAGSTRLVTAASRARPGTVSLRVLKGTVALDGVAVER